MIEPQLSLAFSVHANKGVYAVLLGSGISHAAGIPTGWDIVEDLIRQVAAMHGTAAVPSPAEWYETTYGETPDYAQLLNILAKSPAERQQVLRHYFEPNKQEREEGLKVPTAAHKAIAMLVAAGMIKVIITTNFDRLMEQALEEQGMIPTVVSTPDGSEGMRPLPHLECLVLKVHGDYQDARIKNTPDELASYDPRLDALLDQIVDDYGLIVCGWSANWDTALRAALERCKNHRFSTYWMTRGAPQGKAATLIQLRKATVLVTDADRGFLDLAEKVLGLVALDRPHPISAQLAATALKKYLPDQQQRIRLHDLVHEATEELVAKLTALHDASHNMIAWSAQELERRLNAYEAAVETCQAMLIQGGFWGEADQVSLWADLLQRIVNPPWSYPCQPAWENLRHYPALLLTYSVGMAALAGKNFLTFAEVMTRPSARAISGVVNPLVLTLDVHSILPIERARTLPGQARQKTPVNDRLFRCLRVPMRSLVADDDAYEELFDRYEYLFALVYADQLHQQRVSSPYAPAGCFSWRGSLKSRALPIRDVISAEVNAAGAQWGLFQVGLFRGSVEEFQARKQQFDEWVMRVSFT